MASEKRLIDANDLIAEINEAISNIAFTSPYQSDISTMTSGMERVLDIVEDSPSVDAVEVVHGRWEKSEYNGFVRCDKCKDVYIDESWLTDGKWNYCPNCGAKMDGGNDDGKID